MLYMIMISNKYAFTIVELIVVITILTILSTIAFISVQEYSSWAKDSKILYDIRNLTSAIEIDLSKGWDLDDLVLNDRTITNWVNTWKTVSSWEYILGNLKYEVWSFDFSKLKLNWTDFVYDDSWVDRNYMFWYVKTSNKLYYEFAWQSLNQAWKYDLIISWNYRDFWPTDALWLISENWFSKWLKDWMTLTWSLY